MKLWEWIAANDFGDTDLLSCFIFIYTCTNRGRVTDFIWPLHARYGPSEKCDPVLKEEPLLLSAPASVKTARGSSRQVQADSTMHPEERKRILHLHAEQNRRSALKDGFDQLMDMIPDLYSGGVKPTNAVVLAKAAEHIRRLNAGKEEQLVGKAVLQDKIARLNQRISSLQSNLPSASGVTSTKMEPRAALESFFDRYTKERSKKDFRFWVVAASCSDWLNTHWRAAELRPLASTLLVHLATNTNVLTNPESLEGYVHEQLKNLV
uniref:BHLH domain-containing protein n=1 Tax=Heterorhabditis bacteriophora TaxID=37862 RepID=A0A1I7XA44_HETBA